MDLTGGQLMSNKCIEIKPKENPKCFYHIITATLVCPIYPHDLQDCFLPNHRRETIQKSAAVQAFSKLKGSQSATDSLIFI